METVPGVWLFLQPGDVTSLGFNSQIVISTVPHKADIVPANGKQEARSPGGEYYPVTHEMWAVPSGKVGNRIEHDALQELWEEFGIPPTDTVGLPRLSILDTPTVTPQLRGCDLGDPLSLLIIGANLAHIPVSPRMLDAMFKKGENGTRLAVVTLAWFYAQTQQFPAEFRPSSIALAQVLSAQIA